MSFLLAALSVLSSVLGLTLTNGGTSAFSFFPAIGCALIALITSVFMLRERSPQIPTPSQSPTPVTA